MSISRNLRRSKRLQERMLVKMKMHETPAEARLRKAFLSSAIPGQLREAAKTPPSGYSVPRRNVWARLFLWFWAVIGRKKRV